MYQFSPFLHMFTAFPPSINSSLKIATGPFCWFTGIQLYLWFASLIFTFLSPEPSDQIIYSLWSVVWYGAVSFHRKSATYEYQKAPPLTHAWAMQIVQLQTNLINTMQVVNWIVLNGGVPLIWINTNIEHILKMWSPSISLVPIDSIWRHKSVSTMFQVMVGCLVVCAVQNLFKYVYKHVKMWMCRISF